MAIQTPLANPNVVSTQAVTYWSAPGDYPANYNVQFTIQNLDAVSGTNAAASHFRAMNIAVDSTGTTADRTVVYLDYWNQTRSYVANYSGIHPLLGHAIVSLGSAIVADAFQVGN